MGRETDLVRWRQCSGGKERDFGGIVAGLESTTHDQRTVEHDDAVLARIIEVAVDAKQRS